MRPTIARSPLALLGRAVVAPLALVAETGGRSAARDLGLVALLVVVGAAWFVCGDDAHALVVSVALGRLGWRGWRG
ncbi:MAG: hypothetical protein IT460_01655 [Planctomycetes bacterium]|nr:hypothetical protein [Planctomycetota bacterium]